MDTTPMNEAARLAALRRLTVLYSEPEAALIRIVKVAQHVFGVQGAAITLVDEHRRWFVVSCGINLDATPRKPSFCGEVIRRNDAVVVENTQASPRCQDDALTEKEGIRFYAGAPVTVENRFPVGALCLTDAKPQSFGIEERELLTRLAGVAGALLEGHRDRRQVRSLTSAVEEIEAVLGTEGPSLAPTGSTMTSANEGPPTFTNYDRDATQKGERGPKLRPHVHYDPLTGVMKRFVLEDRLQTALDASPAAGAVLFLDLDRFKYVNGTLGHRTGDRLLQHVAVRLQEAVQPNDAVARVGGDEFVVWLPTIENEDQAVEVARRIADAVSEPVEVDGQTIHVEASAGLVPDTTGYTSAEAVLKDAAAALYRSKGPRGDSITVHEPTMTTEDKTQLRLNTALRQAVEQEAFEPYFLPTVRLDTSTLEGFEILARWRRSDGSLSSPKTFLSIAEETGLIVPIGHQVIEKAFQTLRALQDDYGDDWKVRLSGNFSRREFFREETHAFVADLLARHDIAPSRFTMEITERVIGEGSPENTDYLTDLRELGVQIELDDFGTGYSSLQTLLDFPLDGLKVDRTLLTHVPDDPRAVALLQSVLEMGNRLGLAVTTEGIETKGQLELLQELGCPLGQGYLFSRPVPAHALRDLIDSPPWTNLWSPRG